MSNETIRVSRKTKDPMFDPVPVKGVSVSEFATKNKALRESKQTLLPAKQVTTEEADIMVQTVCNNAIGLVTEAVERGRFTLHDAQGFLAALIALGLRDGHNEETARKITVVGNQVGKLVSLIKAMESVELTQETAERMRNIEDVLGGLTK